MMPFVPRVISTEKFSKPLHYKTQGLSAKDFQLDDDRDLSKSKSKSKVQSTCM